MRFFAGYLGTTSGNRMKLETGFMIGLRLLDVVLEKEKLLSVSDVERSRRMSEKTYRAEALIQHVKAFADFKLSRSFLVYRTKDGIESSQERYPFKEYRDQLNKPMHSMPDHIVRDLPDSNFDVDYRTYRHVQTERRGDREVLVYLEQ